MKTNETPMHTPTPWRFRLGQVFAGEKALKHNDSVVASCEGRTQEELYANAEFIVRAVNEYDDLKASESLWDSTRKANERLVSENKALSDALIMALPYVETALEDKGYKPYVVDRMVKQIRDVIAQAEGGK